jgi:hypothetical protein
MDVELSTNQLNTLVEQELVQLRSAQRPKVQRSTLQVVLEQENEKTKQKKKKKRQKRPTTKLKIFEII